MKWQTRAGGASEPIGIPVRADAIAAVHQKLKLRSRLTWIIHRGPPFDDRRLSGW